MPKIELTPDEQIDQAIAEVSEAMHEKVKADKAFINAADKQGKARYKLQKAKERLNALEIDLKH